MGYRFLGVCPQRLLKKADIYKISYASVIGSIMYAMLYTSPDIARVVSVMSRYRADLGLEH